MWTQICLLRALSRHLSGSLSSFPALSPVGTIGPQWGPGFCWNELELTPPPPAFHPSPAPTARDFTWQTPGTCEQRPVPCHFNA